jgi:hypothetical protein
VKLTLGGGSDEGDNGCGGGGDDGDEEKVKMTTPVAREPLYLSCY